MPLSKRKLQITLARQSYKKQRLEKNDVGVKEHEEKSLGYITLAREKVD
jgi:hypothetical protein